MHGQWGLSDLAQRNFSRPRLYRDKGNVSDFVSEVANVSIIEGKLGELHIDSTSIESENTSENIPIDER